MVKGECCQSFIAHGFFGAMDDGNFAFTILVMMQAITNHPFRI